MTAQDILRIFIRPLTLGRIKVLLFPILVGGVSLDWFVRFKVEKKEVEVMSGSDDIIIPTLLIIVFVFLIIIDYYHYKRTQKFRDKILKLIADPTISDRLKDELVRNLM